MAARRMFAKGIVQSSKFLKMPVSSRELYFQLGMSADDDGIVEAWNVMKLTNATEDDLRVLISKGYIAILNNEDLIAYLTDWNTNNSIRQDRKHDSIYKDLLLMLTEDNTDNQLTTKCQPTDNHCETEVSIGKDNIYICPNEHQKEVDEMFELLWKLYPRKEGKSQVNKKSKEEIFKVGYDRMKLCIENYTNLKKGSDKQYILMGSTFFNGRYKDYLVEENKPIEEVVEVQEDEWTDEEFFDAVDTWGEE